MRQHGYDFYLLGIVVGSFHVMLCIFSNASKQFSTAREEREEREEKGERGESRESRDRGERTGGIV